MGNSLTFNSTYLGNYGVYRLIGDYPTGSEFGVDTVELGTLDGGLLGISRLKPKTISVPIAVTGSGHSGLKSNIDSVLKVLSYRTDASLSFDSWSDRYWTARVIGSPSFQHQGPTVVTGTLQFLCPDPAAFASSATTVSKAVTATPTVPDTLSCTVGGTSLAWPVVTITVTSGTFSQVAIELASTLVRFSWVKPDGAADLSTGDAIKFDCDPRQQLCSIKRSGDSTYTASMSNAEGRFFALNPLNSAETVRVYNIVGNATVVWRNRYL